MKTTTGHCLAKIVEIEASSLIDTLSGVLNEYINDNSYVMLKMYFEKKGCFVETDYKNNCIAILDINSKLVFIYRKINNVYVLSYALSVISSTFVFDMHSLSISGDGNTLLIVLKDTPAQTTLSYFHMPTKTQMHNVINLDNKILECGINKEIYKLNNDGRIVHILHQNDADCNFISCFVVNLLHEQDIFSMHFILGNFNINKQEIDNFTMLGDKTIIMATRVYTDDSILPILLMHNKKQNRCDDKNGLNTFQEIEIPYLDEKIKSFRDTPMHLDNVTFMLNDSFFHIIDKRNFTLNFHINNLDGDDFLDYALLFKNIGLSDFRVIVQKASRFSFG